MDVLRLSSKEYVILEMLIGSGEMFGLQLVDKSHQNVPRGTIYTTLHRMSGKGLVTSRLVDDPAGGPPRRVYRATAKGYRIHSAVRHEVAATGK